MTYIDLADRLFEAGARLTLAGDEARGGRLLAGAERVAALGNKAHAMSDGELLDALGLEEDDMAFVGELDDDALPGAPDVAPAPGSPWRLMRIEGVGPARAVAIARALGVNTVDDLAEFARAGELTRVKGIGAKRAKELAEAIEKELGRAAERQRIRERLADRLATGANLAAEALAIESGQHTWEGTGVGPVVDARTRISDILRCPETLRTGFRIDEDAAFCIGSARFYRVSDGVIDMLTAHSGAAPAQALMETPLYSRGYEQYFRPALTRLVTTQTVDDSIRLSVAMLRLQHRQRVLDVGCGTGNFTRSIANEVSPDQGIVVGLDRSEPMLHRAESLRRQAALDHVVFVRGDALRLPFVDGAFDRVHCSAALQLMPSPELVVREFARVVRPGGRVVIATFVRSTRGWVRRAQRALGPLKGFHWFDPDELMAMIRDAGLAVREEVLEGAAITVAAERT